ncbi:YIP1 family protein [Frigidibacter sp. ROC022]|uniref:YIP1 family protein n=1 Tax=Frigidibacter sp. ROC022 TaxID=2971796 RepID=UPI00215ACC6D|nr:YIP1 family protein [Frigidibacter sp. ROC022]MCR8723711.1 YIP1 family protein [Frigidibacter sp. ROC022]
MSVTGDIWESWRAPRRVLRRLLAQGQREDRVLVYLLVGCGLIYVSSWPGLAQAARLDPSVPLEARLGGGMLAWLALIPLAAYVLAAVSHLLARALGGQGSFYGARLALFWALLAASPAWLAQAALGAVAPGAVARIAAALALAGFLWLWLTALLEAERRPADASA